MVMCNNDGNQLKYSTSHYDFEYALTEEDIKNEKIKIDPYFVSKTWKLGEKDQSGVIFHCLKTIARFGVKNDRGREVKALYFQIKRLAELEGIDLQIKN